MEFHFSPSFICPSTVHTVIQAIRPGDYLPRVQFCEWLLECHENSLLRTFYGQMSPIFFCGATSRILCMQLQ
jgi:hypothetical protein